MGEKIFNEILSELEENENKYNFGQLLRRVRQIQGLTIRKIASEVNKTPTYISDIERGNNKPPEKELIEKIVDALKIQDEEIKCHLYDSAARERGGVSGDMVEYIMGHRKLRRVIRKAQSLKSGEEFWAECLSKIP